MKIFQWKRQITDTASLWVFLQKYIQAKVKLMSYKCYCGVFTLNDTETDTQTEKDEK